MLAPICPHTAEHMYGMLHEGESVMNAKWPGADVPDEGLLQGVKYLGELLHRARVSKQNLGNEKRKN